MIEINKGEGLCEYIRRVESVKEEISMVSGIPLKKMGITITGNEEFINKFRESLPDDLK